ncbi:MAG: Sec-independent protein translocase subunit TatA/TatB, partial [Acidimicrobiales bacterium]
MLDLSPVKLFVVFLVVVVLLGPKRLPEVARQMGAGWRRLRDLYERMDHEVRRNIPDLPSTQDIARLARSPVTFFEQLAHLPADGHDPPATDHGSAPSLGPTDVPAPLARPAAANGHAPPVAANGHAPPVAAN